MDMGRFQVATTWDRFHFARSLPPLAYWSLLGVAGFITGGVLIATYEDIRNLKVLAVHCALGAMLPIAGHYSALAFRKMVLDLGPVLWDGPDNCMHWLEIRAGQIFTLSLLSSKVVTGGIVMLGFATIAYLGLPFVSPQMNTFALVAYTIVIAMCAQAAYVVVRLAEVLIELTGRTPKLPFLLFPHPGIAQLSNFYLSFTVLVALGYGLVGMAVFHSPYEFQPILMIWLSILAFYPLGLFLLWLVRVRRLNQAIRFSFLSQINKEVQSALETLRSSKEKEPLDRLTGLLAIQGIINGIRVWPLDVQSVLAFVVALFTAVSQVLLLVSRLE